MNEERFRRTSDTDTKLLILLNERVGNLQENMTALIKKQSKTPCETHELRIRFVEKGLWIVITAVVLLFGKVLYSLLATA